MVRFRPVSTCQKGTRQWAANPVVMHYDFAQMSAKDSYKLVVSTIVPRPIAWVVSQDGEGHLNAAPYSFFNAISGTPPVLVLGIGSRDEGGHKDTLRNILQTRQFVINLVNQDLARQMNVTATAFAYGVNELEKAGVRTTPSVHVSPPRIAASTVAFECELMQSIPLSETNTLVIGRALACHIEDRYMLDTEKCYVNTPELKLVGRMHGAGWYTSTQELFQIDRYTVEQFESESLKS